MSQINQSDQEKVLEVLTAGVNKVMTAMQPELEKLESELLKKMKLFGASDYDVEQTRKWLRPTMEAEAKKQVYERILKGL